MMLRDGVGEQEQDRGGDILGRAHPAERRGRREAGEALLIGDPLALGLLAELPRQPRPLDAARRDHVDPHACRARLERRRFGQAAERPLGRPVEGSLAHALEAERPADIDHAAMTVGDQSRQEVAHDEERAEHVDVEELAEILDRMFPELLARRSGNARDVDRAVESVAERRCGRRDRGRDILVAGHVSRRDDRASAEIAHLAGDGLDRRDIASDQHEVAARGRDGADDRRPHALGRTGDDEGAPRERTALVHIVRHAVSLRSSMVVRVKIAKATIMLTTTPAHSSPVLR